MGRKIIVTAFAVVIMALIVPWFISPIYNNYLSSRLESDVIDIDLPDESILIDYQSYLGKLNGNGNGMNFLTVLLVETKENIDVIEKSLNVDEIRSKGSIEFEILPIEDKIIKTKYLEREDIIFDSVDEDKLNDDCILIVVYDNGYDGGFDTRGH